MGGAEIRGRREDGIDSFCNREERGTVSLLYGDHFCIWAAGPRHAPWDPVSIHIKKLRADQLVDQLVDQRRPAAGRPAAGRPAAGRPAAGRPATGRPAAGFAGIIGLLVLNTLDSGILVFWHSSTPIF